MQSLPVLPQHGHRHGLENPEVDPYAWRGEPGTWSAIGLKQFSYQPEGDELRMLPAGKSTGQHLWVKQKMPIRGTCGANRMGSTPLTRLLKLIMNNGMTIGPSYSTLVLAKWSIAKSSTNSRPLHGQFVLLPMQGWNWPVFEMFRILGTCLSCRARITAMHFCDSRFEAWCQIFSQFFNASCGTVRCKNGVPHICHAFRTWTWPLAERQSPAWPSHSKIRSARRLKHCCIELDVQKGGGFEGFPTIVKHATTRRWWVLAASLETCVLRWRYPCGTSDIQAMMIAEQG